MFADGPAYSEMATACLEISGQYVVYFRQIVSNLSHATPRARALTTTEQSCLGQPHCRQSNVRISHECEVGNVPTRAACGRRADRTVRIYEAGRNPPLSSVITAHSVKDNIAAVGNNKDQKPAA